MTARQQKIPGMAVDAAGGPVIDPTKNVEDIVRAAVKRLDDLAERDRQHYKEMKDAEHSHIAKLVDRDREHAREILKLQMDRLDAVRNVDVAAVQTAASTAEARAAALANQVTAAAEAMRAANEATRLTFTDTLNSTIKPLSDAIGVIQQWMNQQTGQRAQVVETRDTKQEQRSSTDQIMRIAAFALAIVVAYLAAKRD